MSLLNNLFSSLSSEICIYYSTGAGKGVLTAKQMVPLRSSSSYLIVLKSYLKGSLHLCAVLGENLGMSNVSRTQGDFFFLYTSAFKNFTIMDICVVPFLYMLSPQGEFCIWKHMLI